jgi:DNA polymerase-3 subunit chi
LEVLFYHLTESTLEEALPPLVEKSLERGWRVGIQTASEERRDALDACLWTFRDDSFVPHGIDREPNAAEQPVILTTISAICNGATIRFLVEGAEPDALDG